MFSPEVIALLALLHKTQLVADYVSYLISTMGLFPSLLKDLDSSSTNNSAFLSFHYRLQLRKYHPYSRDSPGRR